MADDFKSRIDTFIGHFQGQIAEIKAFQTTRQELYRNVLYVSVLDALARSRVPPPTPKGGHPLTDITDKSRQTPISFP
jgi:hypothetical protein